MGNGSKYWSCCLVHSQFLDCVGLQPPAWWDPGPCARLGGRRVLPADTPWWPSGGSKGQRPSLLGKPGWDFFFFWPPMNGGNCWEINLRFSDERYYKSARPRKRRREREPWLSLSLSLWLRCWLRPWPWASHLTSLCWFSSSVKSANDGSSSKPLWFSDESVHKSA